MYLIMIKTEAGTDQPYRMADSLDEARYLMAEYLRIAPECGWPVPASFALYERRGLEFVGSSPISCELSSL